MKQQLNEVARMQKLAGIKLNENEESFESWVQSQGGTLEVLEKFKDKEDVEIEMQRLGDEIDFDARNQQKISQDMDPNFPKYADDEMTEFETIYGINPYSLMERLPNDNSEY